MIVSPYDDAESGDNNDSNKIQIMRVIRKNKIQSESSARDNMVKSYENVSNDLKKNNSNNDINNLLEN